MNAYHAVNPIPLNDSKWHHVVGTWNRTGNLTIYVDGVMENTTDISSLTNSLDNSDTLYIGRNSAGNYFNGYIDDVMMFNRSLLKAEVLALYGNTTSNNLLANFSGLTDGAYPFQVYAQDRASNVVTTTSRRPVLGIPLYEGWNLISLRLNRSNRNDSDKNVTIYQGWTLLGYSSDVRTVLVLWKN